MDPLQIVLHYHDQTKHHPQRYARSLGYLDWATQPDPFRRFTGAQLVPLQHLVEDDTPPYDALYDESRITPAALNAESISRFFECSLAVSAWKEYRGTRWALRANPSSGNLHPTEGYLIVGPVENIGPAPGVYHYAPKEHALEQRAEFDLETWQALTAPFPAGSVLVGLTSVPWREAWKYGERAFRYCQHDVGHAVAALRLAAAMLGWRLVMLEGMTDNDVARVLGLGRKEDFDSAEPEHPDLVAVVFPSRHAASFPTALESEAIDRLAAARWSGRANTLSRDHVDWDIIDLAADATRFEGHSNVEGVRVVTAAATSVTPPKGIGHPSAHRIIRRRRSAVAFDGETTITAETFYRILSRVMPTRSMDAVSDNASLETRNSNLETAQHGPIPFDVFSWSPRIHLLLFVHRVVPLSPGLYALVRDPAQRDRLHASMKPEFDWTTPGGRPEDLPLYQLHEADCRKAAAELSLMQNIAGDGAFSLGMVADFDRSLHEFGPWFYRRLFWEAGVVGQVLYLEAEAAGIRATGIGAYFDDWVHEVFGLSGRGFQSLYHFTMGGPVEDIRLTTLPAYPWSRD